MYGKKDWFFPDAELPPRGAHPDLPGHESIIMLNPNGEAAEVEIVLHWTDRAPTKLPKVAVGAGLVNCVRCMEPDGILGVKVEPGVQYAIALHSTVPIVAQYGRLDMRRGPMAFYTTPGYCE